MTGTTTATPDEAPEAPEAPAPGAAPERARLRALELEKELRRVERGKWVRRLLTLLVLGALVAGFMLFRSKTKPPPPARYVTGTTGRGDVTETVQSTGQVKPVTEVQVGAQVSGRITKVYVDFNSKVKKGDLLAEIDPSIFGAQVDSTQAQIAGAKANVARAEANLLSAKQRLERARKLVSEGVGTQAEVDAAQGLYDATVAEVTAAKASIGQLSAALRTTKTNLEFTKIESPIDGVIVSRSIEPGQTVAASFQSPVLFVIAQDLSRMRVLADIDEADVGRLREGMSADVTVDAFPGESFKGTVSQVRYSPQSVAGVVTYAAVVEVENPELKLRPGMTATVTIKSAEAKDVTWVPNAALRFKPSPKTDKDGKPVAEPPLPKLAKGKGRLWVVLDKTPGFEKVEVREVDVGLTDGVNTELKTDLGGLEVVLDETDDAAAKKGRGPRLF